MPKKPETLLSTKVLLRLRAEGGWWMKVHGGPFQAAGIPDILGCWHGKFVAVELKVPGEMPTQLQVLTLKALEAAGAKCGVAYSVEEALAIRDK